jgi:hypothetical protein
MAAMVSSGTYDLALGSRILGNTARGGGMPLYKYVANRALTAFENLMLGTKLSEFHTGYLVFDNEILAQAVAFGFRIGEISCPTRYFAEASSIDFRRAVVYGLGVVRVSLSFRAWRWGLWRPARFARSPDARLQLDA